MFGRDQSLQISGSMGLKQIRVIVLTILIESTFKVGIFHIKCRRRASLQALDNLVAMGLHSHMAAMGRAGGLCPVRWACVLQLPWPHCSVVNALSEPSPPPPRPAS